MGARVCSRAFVPGSGAAGTMGSTDYAPGGEIMLRILLSMLVAGAATVFMSLAPAQTTPAEPAAKPAARPAFDTTKVAGTDNVYIYRYQNAQAMFIVTPEGVIATDPIGYGRPQAVTTYLDEIRKITAQPVKYVIYSHHHFDHIAGGKPFKDAGATFVAHTRAKERLAVLKDPHTVLPDETFDRTRTIKLGGTVLAPTYLGPNHSDNSIVLRAPTEKITRAVDSLP